MSQGSAMSLTGREDRVLVDDLEDGRVAIELARGGPPQRGGQVETEPVDVHLVDPVAKRVGDQPRGLGIRGVEAVARPGEIQIVARVRA